MKHGNRPAREVTRQDALAFRNDVANGTYNPVRLTKGIARKEREVGLPILRTPSNIEHFCQPEHLSFVSYG